MVCLRRLDPELFSHIVPLPGEMHLCAHFLHAVWRLYWKKYLHWFAVRMEMEATIKEEWPVKQWNPHDDFMFIILSACLRFFIDSWAVIALRICSSMIGACAQHRATSTCR